MMWQDWFVMRFEEVWFQQSPDTVLQLLGGRIPVVRTTGLSSYALSTVMVRRDEASPSL